MNPLNSSSLPAWPQRPEFETMPAPLRETAQWLNFTAGQMLFKQGDEPRLIYFIAQGEVRLRRYSPDGAEMVVQRARNSFLAEASIESPAYHCDALASEAAVALAFPLADFRLALAECPNFRGRWISHLLREVKRSRAQCERLGLRNADARVLHYLESECPNGCLVLSSSKKAWAAELGLTHEALYRALSKLSQAGVIRVSGECIQRVQ